MEVLSLLQEEWAFRAMIASSLVGMMCGVIGSFMVLRNMSLIGDALSHAILPGIFVAFVLVGYSSVGFFVGTLIAALVSAMGITWIQSNVKTKNDAAIGIIFTFMFSIGVIGISYLNNQQGVHLDLKDFLFGTILGVSDEDILITTIVTVYVIASVVILFRYLFITTFQPTIAQTMGISTKLIHYFLMLLLSFAVVAALRTVGIILVVAMLITPSATALLLSNKLKYVVILSGVLGLVSAIIGLLAAIALNTTPGPAMCVVATLFYFIAVFLSPSKGLIFRYVRNRKQDRTIEKEDIIKYLYKEHTISSNTIGSMATKLGIKIGNVKRHLQQLKKDGLILLSDTVQLTAKGKSSGEKLVRAHRLWETYLVDKIGLDDQEIHEEAEKYEHLLTADLLDQLDLKLGYPTTDPHGSPIPTKRITAANPLLKLKPKSKARISDNQINSEIESKLWELGLTAQSSIQMVDIDQSKVIIKRGNEHIELEATLAEMINVD